MSAFGLDGSAQDVTRLTDGHIHATFLVATRKAGYVVQRVNDTVFLDVPKMLNNVERIVHHLTNSGRVSPTLIETAAGGWSHRESDGSWWRAFHFLEGTVSRSIPLADGDAYEAGRAFADYLLALTDLPPPPLSVTIERFHDLGSRRRDLDAQCARPHGDRRGSVLDDIGRICEIADEVTDALVRCRMDEWPVRVTHNDAKLSNIRFDRHSRRAHCVIDFDTTMRGHVLYDIGELVRTTTTHRPEDAKESCSVDFDLDLLEALCEGFFSVPLHLTPDEVDTFAWAGPYMAIENAMRFLTDYLAGDQYFSIDRPDHNLDRARMQLRLAELMVRCVAESEAHFRTAARRARSGESENSKRRGDPE